MKKLNTLMRDVARLRARRAKEKSSGFVHIIATERVAKQIFTALRQYHTKYIV